MPPQIDPNMVYLALVIGLWLGVTATYMPGTGILEIVAGAAIIGPIFVLSNMPTNWGAVVVLVLGVLGFIVMPFLKQQFVPLAVGGLVLQTIGGLFMFDGMMVSPLIVAISVVLPLAYHRFALLPILEKARTRPLIDDDDMLMGARGRVVKALNPTGTVQVRGELWTATSDEPLETGDEVEVIERDGLNVYVEAIKRKRESVNGHVGQE